MSVQISKMSALIALLAVAACDDTTPTAAPVVSGPIIPGLAEPAEPEPAAPDVRTQPDRTPPPLVAAATPSIATPVMIDPATRPETCVRRPEQCNAQDDDCDGGIDEGLRNACGECGPAPIEVCNGADDDCDDVIDEQADGVGAACTTGVGACGQTGLTSCDDGALRCAVPAVIEPVAERCDAIDNDCDGSTDEGLGLGETCTVGLGACEATGVRICDERTATAVCAADPGPASPEVCDGTDNDCDGTTDEDVDIEGACISAIGALCQREGGMVCGRAGPTCGAPIPTAGDCAEARPSTLDANGRFACAINDAGQVKCWGDVRALGGDVFGDGFVGNDANEMGGRLAPIDLDMPVRSVVVGGDFACALSPAGQVKCWGENGAGQLGQGDRAARGADDKDMGGALTAIDLDMQATQVVAGADFACALDDAGTVKCWGANSQGTLGQGDRLSRGDARGQMGAQLPAVDLGDFTPVKLAAGDAHVCALDALGKVKCWGANDSLQTGSFGRHAHVGDEDGEMGAALPAVRLGEEAIDISAGPAHTCAVSERGAVFCWGEAYGADPVGLNLRGHSAVRIDAGAQTCVLTDAGRVVCWGTIDGVAAMDDPGFPGTMHRVPLLQPTIELTASPSMNCALDVDGKVRCWGRNDAGQLGQGDDRVRPAGDVSDLAPVILGDAQL